MRIERFNKGERIEIILPSEISLREVILTGPILVTIHDDEYKSEIINSPTYLDIVNYFYCNIWGTNETLIVIGRMRIDDDIKEINLFPNNLNNK